MITHSSEERLALLLSVLGKDASSEVLKNINPTRAVFVTKLLTEYQAEPPTKEELDFVLADFKRYFSFAIESIRPQVDSIEVATASAPTPTRKGKQEAGSRPNPELTNVKPIKPSGNLEADLNRLRPFQIVEALQSEHALSVAIVLNALQTDRCAAVLKSLEDEKRAEAVLLMCDGPTPAPLIVHQVLQSTFDKANQVSVQNEKVDRAEVLASLLRSLPKGIRGSLIETLTEKNEQMIESIRPKLYLFDDVLRLDDRDVQKLISECQSEDLIVALQDCDEELKTKILSNLSKRARQAIEVEIEYKTGVSEAEIEEARSNLTTVIAALDESGDINLE